MDNKEPSLSLSRSVSQASCASSSAKLEFNHKFETSSLEKRILALIGGQEDQLVFKEFTKIILDGVKLQSFNDQDKAFLEKFENVQKLTMNICDLETLENFPHLPKLRILELQDNFIQSGFLNLKHLTKLETLSLEHNMIKDFTAVKELLVLERLKNLNLNFNPIGEKGEVRDRIFETMPNLEYLDRYDKDGNEGEFEEELADEEMQNYRKPTMVAQDSQQKEKEEEEEEEEDKKEDSEDEADFGQENEFDFDEDDEEQPVALKKQEESGKKGESEKKQEKLTPVKEDDDEEEDDFDDI